MLYATGLEEADMNKAQVGISSAWFEGNTCNMHLMDLSSLVRESVARAALASMGFKSIGVSDGISMGTSGMRYSLQSREIIADGIEIFMNGCDKNMPGVVMAMGPVSSPSVVIYGGSIKPGCSAGGQTLDLVTAFQSYGQYISGQVHEAQRFDIIRHACPGSGACGGMYIANTMATAIEVLAPTVPGSSSCPAEDPRKKAECEEIGETVKNFLKEEQSNPVLVKFTCFIT